MPGRDGHPRFLTLADVAEILNTSQAQVYALVKRNELLGIQIGGRGQWRVETDQLEAFIQRMYDRADPDKGQRTGDGDAEAPDVDGANPEVREQPAD
jgi:excisionase family DNA binding protein